MCAKIFYVTFVFIFFVNNILTMTVTDEEYVDSIINMLLNGNSLEVEESQDDEQGGDIALIGGVWKCGNCADVDDSKLVYSEVNDLEIDITENQPVEAQISLSIPSMSCVVVVGDRPGVVRRVAGACIGEHVALSIAASNHFTVNVYAE